MYVLFNYWQYFWQVKMKLLISILANIFSSAVAQGAQVTKGSRQKKFFS